MILCKKEFAKTIDSAIFPGIQGGPLMHVVAAKAVALKAAMTESLRNTSSRLSRMRSHLAKCLADKGYRIVSGGTDNHLFLVDLTGKGITGKEAQEGP